MPNMTTITDRSITALRRLCRGACTLARALFANPSAMVLWRRAQSAGLKQGFRLREGSVAGAGLAMPAASSDWRVIAELIYDNRGGVVAGLP